MAEKKLQPIIIKRVKKGGHAAHGGAWKIAYADFVTAMMAFFLLMWLLGSTAKGDLKGISDYFGAPLKVAMTGGDGSGNSNSIITGGGINLTKIEGQTPRRKSQEERDKKKTREEIKAEQAKQDAEKMAVLQAKIESLLTQNPRLKEFLSQIDIQVTPDGLQIQIIDDQNRPMFDIGSAIVKPYMRDILREMGAALGGVENLISLAGHTDAAPYSKSQRGYSNWELSSDRANASRRELVSAGMPDEKLGRVVGLADSNPFKPEDPRAPTNRRITITVLTREAQERLLGRTEPVVKLEEVLPETTESTIADSPKP